MSITNIHHDHDNRHGNGDENGHDTEPVRRRGTGARYAAAAAIVLSMFAASACSSNTNPEGPDGASGEPAAIAAAGDAAGADDAPVDADDPAGDDAEDANDLLDDSDDQPEPADPTPELPPPADDGDEPVDIGPSDADEPASGPCDSLPADGSSLVVGPDPLVLDKGDLTGSIFIVNCSDGDIDWTASTKPSVALDDSGANLLPGQFAELDFQIDHTAWAPGAVDFKVKVSEPGHNHYVDVHAFRQLVGKDVVAGGGNLSAGPGAGGCANQCIVSALLKPNFTSPDLGLDITTNTPARIRTSVSKNAPSMNGGVPTFPGVPPIDESPAGVTQHHATLSPLSAATKYHIIVSATDEFDHTSYRIGEFTTITPVSNPGDFKLPGDAPGCAAGCVTKAQLTAGGDYSSKHLSIASHTAAQFQVFVSTDAPIWTDDVPSLPDADVWVPSGLEYVTAWETDLEGLAASTNYHILVRAEDANGNVDHRTGTFTTAAAPTHDVVFTNLGIKVHDDGDKGANRGELQFGWRVGEGHAGSRGEAKISSGDWVQFSRPNSSYVAYGIVDFLPTVFVAGFERDPDGKIEFCSMGTGVPSDNGSNDKCDVVWSVAGSGIVSLGSLAGYPTCVDLGFNEAYGDQRCLTLTTGDTNGGRPEFTTYVAVKVLD